MVVTVNGKVSAWDYAKSRPVPGSEASNIVAGGDVIPTEAGAHGRLAGAICFDLDFPALTRQVGLARADVLLAPADDWAAIKATHSLMHVFRAIENGVSLIRPTLQGTSVAVDHHGRLLAAGDYFTSPDGNALVAEVPTRGVRTFYTVIGDSAAYLCVAGLLLLVGRALFTHRDRSAVEAVPGPQSEPATDPPPAAAHPEGVEVEPRDGVRRPNW